MITKIHVNLLPSEVLFERIQSSKLVFINKVSVGVLLVLIFITSATIALRLSQGTELKEVKEDVVKAETMAAGLQTRSSKLSSLKSRLGSIKTLLEADAKRRAIFNLVIYLIPADVTVSEVVVDAGGVMTVSLSSSSLSSIETLISNLSSKDKNSDLISRINLETLSLGGEMSYRMTLRLVPKT